MDPRLAERRRRVAEDRARSNMARLIRFLLVVATLAGLVWLLQSPFLSVSRIIITGAEQVDVRDVLDNNGVVEGRAMVALNLDASERLLNADPWVESVAISREWPTTVRVELVERTAAVNVRFTNGWSIVAADGTVLEKVETPVSGLPRAEFDEVASRDGGTDLNVVGAVEYLAGLAPHYRSDAVVRPTTDGMEATVDGYTVRIGGPFEMTSKAAVTAALLDTGLEEGSILTVVAPASPAVLPPGAVTPTTTGDPGNEGDSEGETSTDDTSG